MHACAGTCPFPSDRLRAWEGRNLLRPYEAPDAMNCVPPLSRRMSLIPGGAAAAWIMLCLRQFVDAVAEKIQ